MNWIEKEVSRKERGIIDLVINNLGGYSGKVFGKIDYNEELWV